MFLCVWSFCVMRLPGSSFILFSECVSLCFIECICIRVCFSLSETHTHIHITFANLSSLFPFYEHSQKIYFNLQPIKLFRYISVLGIQLRRVATKYHCKEKMIKSRKVKSRHNLKLLHLGIFFSILFFFVFSPVFLSHLKDCQKE